MGLSITAICRYHSEFISSHMSTTCCCVYLNSRGTSLASLCLILLLHCKGPSCFFLSLKERKMKLLSHARSAHHDFPLKQMNQIASHFNLSEVCVKCDTAYLKAMLFWWMRLLLSHPETPPFHLSHVLIYHSTAWWLGRPSSSGASERTSTGWHWCTAVAGLALDQCWGPQMCFTTCLQHPVAMWHRL